MSRNAVQCVVCLVVVLSAGSGFSREIARDTLRGELDSGWAWIRESREHWRTTDDGLEIRVLPGNMWGPANDAKNVLARSLPKANDTPLSISITVENQPTEQYEQVDLVWYCADSHMVKIGQELVDGQLSIVMGREEQDRTRTIKILPLDKHRVALRLDVQHNSIRGYFRPDGDVDWHLAGECDLPLLANVEPRVTIQAYQGPAGKEHWARLTDFAITTGDGGQASVNKSPPLRFEPTWESLNARVAPAWFNDAKFGIFIHWGVYSVPAFSDTSTYSEWYLWWLKTNAHNGFERAFHERVYGKDFPYREFAPLFRAELWDPAQWAKIFERSGAKYVVLTTKHHDGFCLWPSAEASKARGYAWNSVETGPKRDLVGELTSAVRQRNLRMGFYYSFMEWDNPLFDRDKPEYVNQVMLPQLRELTSKYQPDIIWPDGEWEHPDSLWRSTEYLAWLYNESPNRHEVVVNDRWGKDLRAKTGDFFTTEYSQHAGEGATSGSKAFEECRGIGRSFALNRAEDYDMYMSRTDAVRLLIDTVSAGGNLLLDIGPAADGQIPLLMQDRLFAIGEWLKLHGDAIFGTQAGPFPKLTWGRTTAKQNTLYLHVYDWPADGKLLVPPLSNEVRSAQVVGTRHPTSCDVRRGDDRSVTLDLSSAHPAEHATVVALVLDSPPQALDAAK